MGKNVESDMEEMSNQIWKPKSERWREIVFPQVKHWDFNGRTQKSAFAAESFVEEVLWDDEDPCLGTLAALGLHNAPTSPISPEKPKQKDRCSTFKDAGTFFSKQSRQGRTIGVINSTLCDKTRTDAVSIQHWIPAVLPNLVLSDQPGHLG